MSVTEKDNTEAEKGTSVEKERGIMLMCKKLLKNEKERTKCNF